MEDVWRGEVQQLLSQISQLQAENRRLLQTLPPSQPPVQEEDSENQEGRLSVEFHPFSSKDFHFLDTKHVYTGIIHSIGVCVYSKNSKIT